MSVESWPVQVLFPQGEHRGLIPASSDIEADHAFLLARGFSQLSEHRFSSVCIFGGKLKMDGLNEHVVCPDAYFAEELAASMITAATRSGIESIGT
jgi:hypothetical protein